MTGASRMSSRTEVSDDVLNRIREALLYTGGEIAGWTIASREVSGGYEFDLWHSGTKIVQCWFCTERGASDRMFEEASATAIDERVILARPKGTPWLGVTLFPESLLTALSNPSILLQAGDLERCVAWTLLEKHRL